MTYFNGYRVILTSGSVSVPVRPHAKRRNQGKRSYHSRITKKWLKRFGVEWEQVQKRGEVLMMDRSTIVVRNDDWDILLAMSRNPIQETNE